MPSTASLPQVEPFVFGIKPAVLAIIAAAILKLGKKALKGWELGVLGTVVLAASLLGVNEILALLGAGVFGAVYFFLRDRSTSDLKSIFPLIFLQTSVTTIGSISTIKVFWTFLKVGAVLYEAVTSCSLTLMLN